MLIDNGIVVENSSEGVERMAITLVVTKMARLVLVVPRGKVVMIVLLLHALPDIQQRIQIITVQHYIEVIPPAIMGMMNVGTLVVTTKGSAT